MPLGLFGALEATLQATEAFFPSLVAGEAWIPDYSVRPLRWNQLAAFFTPTPLVASHSQPGGKIEQKVIDIQLARTFASQHQLSLRLAATVAKTGVPEWCYDLSGDDMLKRITFNCQTVIALPVFASRSVQNDDIFGKDNAPKECRVVLILYSSHRETRTPPVDQGLSSLTGALGRLIEISSPLESLGSLSPGFGALPTIDLLSGSENDGKKEFATPLNQAPASSSACDPPISKSDAHANLAEAGDDHPHSSEQCADAGCSYYSIREVPTPGSPSPSAASPDAGDTLISTAPHAKEPSPRPAFLSVFDPLTKRVLGFIKFAATCLRATKAELWVQYRPHQHTPGSAPSVAPFYLLEVVFLGTPSPATTPNANTTPWMGTATNSGSANASSQGSAQGFTQETTQGTGCTISSLSDVPGASADSRVHAVRLTKRSERWESDHQLHKRLYNPALRPQGSTNHGISATSSGTVATPTPSAEPSATTTTTTPPTLSPRLLSPIASANSAGGVSFGTAPLPLPRLGSNAKGMSLALCQKCAHSKATVVWFGSHELAALALPSQSRRQSFESAPSPVFCAPNKDAFATPSSPAAPSSPGSVATDATDVTDDQTPHWDFAAALPFSSSTPLNAESNVNGWFAVPGPHPCSVPCGSYQFVLLLYWNDAQEHCRTPQGTRLLSLISHSAQLALSRAFSPTFFQPPPPLSTVLNMEHLELCANPSTRDLSRSPPLGPPTAPPPTHPAHAPSTGSTPPQPHPQRGTHPVHQDASMGAPPMPMGGPQPSQGPLSAAHPVPHYTRSPSAPPALSRYDVPYDPSVHSSVSPMLPMDPTQLGTHPHHPPGHSHHAPPHMGHHPPSSIYDPPGPPQHIPRRRTASVPSSTRFAGANTMDSAGLGANVSMVSAMGMAAGTPPQHIRHPQHTQHAQHPNGSLHPPGYAPTGSNPYASTLADVRMAPPLPPGTSPYPPKNGGKGYGTVHPVLQRNWSTSGQSEELAYIPTALSFLSLDSAGHTGPPPPSSGTSSHERASPQQPGMPPSNHPNHPNAPAPASASQVQVGAYLTPPPPGMPTGLGPYGGSHAPPPPGYYPPMHRREPFGSGPTGDAPHGPLPPGSGFVPIGGHPHGPHPTHPQHPQHPHLHPHLPGHPGRYMNQGPGPGPGRSPSSLGPNRSNSNPSPSTTGGALGTAGPPYPNPYYRDEYARFMGPPAHMPPHPALLSPARGPSGSGPNLPQEPSDPSLHSHNQGVKGTMGNQESLSKAASTETDMSTVPSTLSVSASGKMGPSQASASSGSVGGSSGVGLGGVSGRFPSTGTLPTDSDCVSLADFHVRLPPMPPLLRTNSDSALHSMTRSPGIGSSMNPGIPNPNGPISAPGHSSTSQIGMPLYVSPLVHGGNPSVLPPALPEFPISAGSSVGSGANPNPAPDRSLYHPGGPPGASPTGGQPLSKPMRSHSVPIGGDGLSKIPSFFPSPYDSATWRGGKPGHMPPYAPPSHGSSIGQKRNNDPIKPGGAAGAASGAIGPNGPHGPNKSPVLSYMNRLGGDDSSLSLQDTYPWSSSTGSGAGSHPWGSSQHAPWATDAPDTDGVSGFGAGAADDAYGLAYAAHGMSVPGGAPGSGAVSGPLGESMAFGRKRTRTQGQSGLHLPGQSRASADSEHDGMYSASGMHSGQGHSMYTNPSATSGGASAAASAHSSASAGAYYAQNLGSSNAHANAMCSGNYPMNRRPSQYPSSHHPTSVTTGPIPAYAPPLQAQHNAHPSAREPQNSPQEPPIPAHDVGLPVVPASSLSRVKGRAKAAKPKMNVALRRGKWTESEEAFANAVINAFRAGVLPVAENATLRTFLSAQLHCAPMRITKKYAKDASIGKFLYRKNMDYPSSAWQEQAVTTVIQILQYRDIFFANVLNRNRIDLHSIVPEIFDLDLMDDESKEAVEKFRNNRAKITIPTLAPLTENSADADTEESTYEESDAEDFASSSNPNLDSDLTSSAHATGLPAQNAYNGQPKNVSNTLTASILAQFGANFTNTVNAMNAASATSNFLNVVNAMNAAKLNATTDMTANPSSTPSNNSSNFNYAHFRTQAILSSLGLLPKQSTGTDTTSNSTLATATASSVPSLLSSATSDSIPGTSASPSTAAAASSDSATLSNPVPGAMSELFIRVPALRSDPSVPGLSGVNDAAQNDVSGLGAAGVGVGNDGSGNPTANEKDASLQDGDDANAHSYAADLLDNSPVPYFTGATPKPPAPSTFSAGDKKVSDPDGATDTVELGLSPVPHRGSNPEYLSGLYPSGGGEATPTAPGSVVDSGNKAGLGVDATGTDGGSGHGSMNLQKKALPSFFAPVLTSMKSFE